MKQVDLSVISARTARHGPCGWIATARTAAAVHRWTPADRVGRGGLARLCTTAREPSIRTVAFRAAAVVCGVLRDAAGRRRLRRDAAGAIGSGAERSRTAPKWCSGGGSAAGRSPSTANSGRATQRHRRRLTGRRAHAGGVGSRQRPYTFGQAAGGGGRRERRLAVR
eukprot:ctg_3134.g650